MVKLTGHVARTREKGNAYRNLVWRPLGKSSLGRARNKEEDNIKMKLKVIGRKG